MSVRIFATGSQNDTVLKKPEYEDASFTQRETTVDGYTFHWGVNETRNFADDGVGLAHAGFVSGDAIVEDTIPFGDSRS